MDTYKFIARLLIAAFSSSLFIFGTRATAQAESRRPNFVIFYVDDLGYGDLSCFGNPTIDTPNLDRMAAEGMKLTHFYAPSSICSPSRAGFLTGRLPARCGVNGVFWPDSENGLPKSEVTVARLLRDSGYATACIGKWHLGHAEGYLPTARGFDLFYGLPCSNDMWISSDASFSNDAQFREGAGVETVRSGDYERHSPAYVPLMLNEQVITFPADQAALTRQYTEQAIGFIRENMDKPFFLYVPNNAPHTPLFASERFRGKSLRGRYGDVVEEIDWSVGKILAELKSHGLDSNTLVIFTSDNGPWETARFNGGSAGLLRGGKFTTWEGGFRVPAIAWWPATIEPGQVHHGISSALDLMPTLLDFAGVELPNDRVLDGYSLRDMIIDGSESPREEIFFYRHGRLRAVRVGEWKLHYETMPGNGEYEYTEHDPPLLFRIDMDPGERFDVAARNPQVVQRIERLIEEHRRTFE